MRKTITLAELKRLGACERALKVWPFGDRRVPISEAIKWAQGENLEWWPWLAAQSMAWAKTYIGMGFDIHDRDDSTLRFAAYYGHLDVVKYLVEQGANIRARGDCAIMWAKDKGHLDVVDYFKSVSGGASDDILYNS
jgi:hypothetical protein